MDWEFFLPVRIVFGNGKLVELNNYIAGMNKGLIVCDPFMRETAEEVMARSGGGIAGVWSGVSPNPDVSEVDACCAELRWLDAEFIVALGGGSAIDLAKAASVISQGDQAARAYHTGGEPLPQKNLPLVAVPTTAGTGSEVTNVSVLTDAQTGVKAPMASPLFYAKMALIDPLLTRSVPPQVTASTGLDVLAHALEGFWSSNHQPICDALAVRAAHLVFKYLYDAYKNPQDRAAREAMCEASVLAGIAFSHPKTAGSHACSYPLTNLYGMPHGEACAFTLDSFVRINADWRLEGFAMDCGFDDADQMADAIGRMKADLGMKRTLADAGIRDGEIEALAKASMHPNMKNNPVKMSEAAVAAMYRGLK